MIDKLCYVPNLIYFDLLSHLKLDKLNEILTHQKNLNEISRINKEGY